MRTVFGSCVAVVLAMAAVAAQQQPAGEDQQSQSRTGAPAAQAQQVTITGCIEEQPGGTPNATEFVLVSAEPAGATGSSSTGRPTATGTTGTTSGRANAGMRYSLSGSSERQLRVGQRVEIVGRTQNRGNAGQGQGSASTSSAPSSTERTPGQSRGETAETTRGATGASGVNANMPMLEVVSYKVVPGNCN